MYYVKIYSVMLICFFAIDLVWLGLVARSFYEKQIGFLLRPSPNWPVAITFYLIYITGILVFVVNPSLQSESWKKAILLGAFYGFVTYATYDLTNHAVVKDWPWIVSVVDIAWGTVLATAVGSAGYAAGRWFLET